MHFVFVSNLSPKSQGFITSVVQYLSSNEYCDLVIMLEPVCHPSKILAFRKVSSMYRRSCELAIFSESATGFSHLNYTKSGHIIHIYIYIIY